MFVSGWCWFVVVGVIYDYWLFFVVVVWWLVCVLFVDVFVWIFVFFVVKVLVVGRWEVLLRLLFVLMYRYLIGWFWLFGLFFGLVCGFVGYWCGLLDGLLCVENLVLVVCNCWWFLVWFGWLDVFLVKYLI